jgi:hypothetical protein
VYKFIKLRQKQYFTMTNLSVKSTCIYSIFNTVPEPCQIYGASLAVFPAGKTSYHPN